MERVHERDPEPQKRYVPGISTEPGQSNDTALEFVSRGIRSATLGVSMAGDELQRGAKQETGPGFAEGLRAAIQSLQGSFRQGDVDPLCPAGGCYSELAPTRRFLSLEYLCTGN